MFPFKQIDAWLIKYVFQALVDGSQRHGRWWSFQCVIGIMVLAVIRTLLDGASYSLTMLVVGFIVWGLMLALTAHPSIYQFGVGRQTAFRWVWAAMAAVHVYAYGVSASVFIDVLGACYYWFATCTPPKPPKRKHSLVPSGASS